MNWRRLNTIIHRDLGYLCFGLTMIYAISGIAVNHIHSWNPNYLINQERGTIDNLPGGPADAALTTEILKRIEATGEVKNTFQPDPNTLQIFLEGNTVTVNLNTGETLQEKVTNRPLLRQMNYLHLNHPKKLWTWFADLYALCLGVLACSGLFILKGKNGMKGRGGWLTGAGLLIPLFFLWLYF
ncbi:MAG: PepSY-associated TM helix domain-containing protein [Proteobacteria bacterium]|nr:PepSY-associated TM helix domain-containing protein [Pseudomonadota bacterium]MBU1687623.1 PepSY-associated TM helix domain-containing protein [Pseudomonadota bacterium]